MNVSVKRVFILRPDNLGDLVLFTGALRHIRRKWSDAEITLCVRSYGLGLFADCPYVDKLVPYESFYDQLAGKGRFHWMPRMRGADRIGNWLRPVCSSIARHIYATDLAILPVLSPCSDYHRTMRALFAREKIGICGNVINQTSECDRSSRSWYSAQMDASDLPGNFPELEATRLFLQYLGMTVNSEDLWPEFWTSCNDRQMVIKLFAEGSHRKVIGVVPGFSNLKKYLPPEWFEKVLSGFNDAGSKIILLGSGADLPICTAVAHALTKENKGGDILNLAGKSTLSELVECVRRCDVLLCQDSATLHIAAGLRKPVIGIMGGGHYGRFYPWGLPHLSRVIRKKMDCYGCNWRCQFDTVRCIQEISPEDAISELQALMSDLTV